MIDRTGTIEEEAETLIDVVINNKKNEEKR